MKTGDVIDNVVYLKLFKLLSHPPRENVHQLRSKKGSHPYSAVEMSITNTVYTILELSKENLGK